MLAAEGGHTEIVLLLLDQLAEINMQTVVRCVLVVCMRSRVLHMQKVYTSSCFVL